MTAWHERSVTDSVRELSSDTEYGLSTEEAEARRIRHGPNELLEISGRGPALIIWEQLSSSMVVLLVVASVVSLVLHEFTDAFVILAIVVLNAALGFVQDYRAERSLAALKKLAVPKVRARRDGKVQELSARELVPGDVILVEVGNKIPADCRLWESVNLRVQESALTGESEAVEKQTEPLQAENPPLGDRNNMLYMGTTVTFGHGQAIVTAIGMNTELGQVAQTLQMVKAEPTPLQKRLAQLGRSLALVAVGIVALVFLIGLLRGEEPRLMLLTALSMAVAVVPEGLPAVATVALALGAKRMLERQALIRKLPAVETLGSVTVICSDKTGTLTENKMAVTVLDVAGEEIDLTGSDQVGCRNQAVSDGDLRPHEQRVAENSSFALLLAGSGLCNDVELQYDKQQQLYTALGDPTEAALVVAAAQMGLPKSSLQRVLPRQAEIAFDSVRKRMTTIHRVRSLVETDCLGPVDAALAPITALDGEYFAFTKGAVDSILDVCKYVWFEDQPTPLDESWATRIAASNENLASQGMRVLGVAFRPIESQLVSAVRSSTNSGENSGVADIQEEIEEELIFVGIVGMIDPPRSEVAAAVARCRSAGIRPVMITGDHPLTAQHIAKQLTISEDGQVLTGQELEKTSQQELEELASEVSVYARVAPHHKMRLIKAYQDTGHVVAMTGDGVNDAPALKQAHIGVAMGITGTDVSKEASQMVLLDDNFATIVKAVEQGRVVYDNIRKFVKYTMTSNAGEISVMVLGPLMGTPLPLLPLQILWINLVTDGLPGLALAVEKAESDTMRRPPYPPQEHVIERGMAWEIAWIGGLMGVVSLLLSVWYWPSNEAEQTLWRTLIFTVLTLSQLGNALATRSARESLFQIGIMSNRAMLASVSITFLLQLLVIYWPPLQKIFKTTGLSPGELLVCLLLSTTVFWAVEGQKWLSRRGQVESGFAADRSK